jgi:hypothetical protein
MEQIFKKVSAVLTTDQPTVQSIGKKNLKLFRFANDILGCTTKERTRHPPPPVWKQLQSNN